MLDASLELDHSNDDVAQNDNLVADIAAVAQECQARARIYRMLAGVFVEEPSLGFLSTMSDIGWLRALEHAGVTFESDFLDTNLATLVDTLACEYATLFASSGGFPPVESVRLTGRFKQEPHYQVSKFYRRMGYVQVKGRFEVFADQLGMELMFVAEMLDRAAYALGSGDVPAYRAIDKEIKKFWTLHLGRWVRGYSDLITRASNHSFYRGMARFLHGFAKEEIAAMGLKRLEDLDQGQLQVPKSEIVLEFNPDEPVCGECPSGREPRTSQQGGNRVIPIAELNDLQI